MDLTHLQRFSAEYSGAYAPEQSGAVGFRWVNQKSKLRLYRLLGGGFDCVALKFVSAWPESKQKIRIEAVVEERIFDLPKMAAFDKPHVERFCLQFDEGGEAEINLTASEPGKEFPGDGRPIAFGLIQSLD